MSDIMILLDGVNVMDDYNNSYSLEKINLPVEAIDKIEVIRGNVSGIYGSTAYTGVINIITNEQHNDKDNQVSVTRGALKNNDVNLRLSGSQKDIKFVLNYGLKSFEGIDAPYASFISGGSTTLAGLNIDPT